MKSAGFVLTEERMMQVLLHQRPPLRRILCLPLWLATCGDRSLRYVKRNVAMSCPELKWQYGLSSGHLLYWERIHSSHLNEEAKIHIDHH